ncbi:MAG: hypothetical protein ACKO5Q_27495, partial [Microcystaceae cyanobacterium]
AVKAIGHSPRSDYPELPEAETIFQISLSNDITEGDAKEMFSDGRDNGIMRERGAKSRFCCSSSYSREH